MKTLKHIFVLMMFCFAILYSCNEQDDVLTEDIDVSKAELSGEEMFQNIFFSVGKYVSKIPTFDNQRVSLAQFATLRPDIMQEYQAEITRLIDLIDQKNPEYFDALKSAVFSQNFNAIEEALGNGQRLLMAVSKIDFIENIDGNRAREVFNVIDMNDYDFSVEESINQFNKDVSNALSALGINPDKMREKDNTQRRVLVWPGFAITYRTVANINIQYTLNSTYNINLTENFNIAENYNINSGSQQRNATGSFHKERMIVEIAQAFN